MDLTAYNTEQQSAITCRKKIVIVPAGPGSGKSHTLVGRVVYRVTVDHVDPDSIVILTFTNNAAKVFVERLAKHGIRVGYAGTLHGYCMRLLQAYGSLLGYRQGTITILTQQASEALLAQVREELHFKITDKELKGGDVWRALDKQTREVRLIWSEYAYRMKRANMVNYDRILIDALDLLKRDSIKILVAGGDDGIDELLVDERQDSGEIDTQIFWEIPAKRRFFVGDVDQSIFAFRGAKPELFIEESKQHGYIALEKNYRSDTEICRVANNLIRYNVDRVPKLLDPVSTHEGLTMCEVYENDGTEIYGIWSKIKNLSAGGGPLNEIAVLARTNSIADKFRETLRGLGLPVAGVRHQRLPDDWSYALSAIGLLIDPANDYHAEAILRSKGTPDAQIREFKLKAAKNGSSLATAAVLPNTRPVTIADASIILHALQISRESMKLIRDHILALPAESGLSDLLVDLWHAGADQEQIEEGVTVTTVHCSPPDEPILTSGGPVPICELNPSEHRLPSLNPHCNQLTTGRSKCGFPFRVSERAYEGDLITLTTCESRTRITPEHRVRVRFDESFYGKWTVYLMRRGRWWRIGVCGTIGVKPYKSGGVAGRLGTEKADGAWVLGVYDSRSAAIRAETLMQTKYGITGLPFERTHFLKDFTTPELHKLHDEIADQSGKRVSAVFKDFRLIDSWPLYQRGDGQKRCRHAYWFDTCAANVLSGYMRVPVARLNEFWNNSRAPRHQRVTVSREHYRGLVYSLEVKPYEFYVSGGAIVHNSAKGREWDRVFLVAMEEGVFPSKQAIDAEPKPAPASIIDTVKDDHIERVIFGSEAWRRAIPVAMEEERRLCFVAITRARHWLHLSWARKRTAFYQTSDMRGSRFIGEMTKGPLSAGDLDAGMRCQEFQHRSLHE